MKTYLKSCLLPLCAGAFLLAGSAVADTSKTSVEKDKDYVHGKSEMNSKVSRADHRFFKKASHLGEKEVALSRIAADRATNPQVRAFASEMVSAHTTANTELSGLMKHRGVVLDDRDQDIEHRELAKKWNEKKADDFDEDYLEAMIDAHQDTIDVLENGIESKDTDIAAYAAQLLPAVKAHLAKAEKLEELVD
jgi:putative membrane protein